MKNSEKLKDLQSAPLRYKIILTEERIREAVEKYTAMPCKEILDTIFFFRFYSIPESVFIVWSFLIEQHKKAAYISFSGGVDSLVLMTIALRLYPEMKVVFFDTGLEDPRIRSFVRTFPNVVWIEPKKAYKEVIEKHGYPILSKSISMAISRYRNAWKAANEAILSQDWAVYLNKFKQMSLRLHGGINPTSGRKQTTGVIPKKWHDLAKNGTFKVSDECCNALKKMPAKEIYKEFGGCALIGTMASDSHNRKLDYYKHGCNAFGKKMPQSRPLMLWSSTDVWQYIREYNLKYAEIYNEKDCVSSGCDGCLMGIEKDRERFVRLKKARPYRWKYFMNKLGYREILKAINIPSGEDESIKQPEVEEKDITIQTRFSFSDDITSDNGGEEVGRKESDASTEASASQTDTPEAEAAKTEAWQVDVMTINNINPLLCEAFY